MARPRVPDADILAQIPAARRRARATHPVAAEARYDRARRCLRIGLTNGTVLSVPIALLPPLRHATDRELGGVTVGAAGLSLRWERMDEDLSISALAQLALGRGILLRASGAAGGAARTTAKAQASRTNGALGGRPRKITRLG